MTKVETATQTIKAVVKEFNAATQVGGSFLISLKKNVTWPRFWSRPWRPCCCQTDQSLERRPCRAAQRRSPITKRKKRREEPRSNIEGVCEWWLNARHIRILRSQDKGYAHDPNLWEANSSDAIPMMYYSRPALARVWNHFFSNYCLPLNGTGRTCLGTSLSPVFGGWQATIGPWNCRRTCRTLPPAAARTF